MKLDVREMREAAVYGARGGLFVGLILSALLLAAAPPARMTPAQEAALVASLKSASPRVLVILLPPRDAERAAFAERLSALFSSARWEVQTVAATRALLEKFELDPADPGVGVIVTPEKTNLAGIREALAAGGLEKRDVQLPAGCVPWKGYGSCAPALLIGAGAAP